MRAILLAAGRGKRLQPLTDTTPKPLLKIGKKPIIHWILEGLRGCGITECAIITGHLEDKLKAQLGTGSAMGMKLYYFSQEVQDGTARAVLPAREFAEKGAFFLGYGDIFVAPENYSRMFKTFCSGSNEPLLAAWEVPDPSQCGALEITGGKLTGLVEKPAPGTAPSNFINAGLMMMTPELFTRIDRVKPSPRGEYELTDALLSLAIDTGVGIHRLVRYWSDIGTREKLRETNAWIQKNIRQ